MVQYEVFSGIQGIFLLLDIILFLLHNTVLVTFLPRLSCPEWTFLLHDETSFSCSTAKTPLPLFNDFCIKFGNDIVIISVSLH